METLLGLLLTGCALLGASAVNPCLDPTNASYLCEVDEDGKMDLSDCGLTDDDVDGGDLASCLDDVGREIIVNLWLSYNDFTTLPAGIFDGLTALLELRVGSSDITILPAGIFDGLTTVKLLSASYGDLTTLPAGIFEGLTSLQQLWLNNNEFTTLPAGIFDGLTALLELRLNSNALTTLPAGIFDDLTALEVLSFFANDLISLPPGIFDGLAALRWLTLSLNDLVTLPAGIFDDLTALEVLFMSDNALTTLPAGIFEGLTTLERLTLQGNSLDCLPIVPSTLVEVDDDASDFADGLHVDPHGDECGCSVANVTENVCSEEICTPGSVGYTCDPAVFTPAPMSAATAAPLAAITAPTPAPVLAATAAPVGLGETRATSPAPTPAPSFATNSTTSPPLAIPPEQKSASDSTPIVAGVVSAVAGAALVALAIYLKRRRGSSQKIARARAVPPTQDDVNVEQGREEPPDVRPPPCSAVVAVDHGDENSPSHQRNASPHGHTLAEVDTVDTGGFVLSSTASFRDEQVQQSPEHAENSTEGCCSGLAGENVPGGSAKKFVAANTASTATTSTTNLSAAERDELSQFHQRESEAASVSGGPRSEEASTGGPGVSPVADRQNSADIGLGRAVLAAAQELAHHCQIPGVSEAATAVCMMANLVTDGRDNARASESRLRQCSTVVVALKRAAKVADRGGDTIGVVARGMIEDVHGAIFDLVQLVETYQSKNKLSRLFMSTLFKRRQEELDAVVDQAIMRLQLGLQLQVGQDVGAVKDKFDSVKEGMDLYQLSLSEAASESMTEARRIKRQRKLDQVEIPAEYVSITDELLGKGGFGEVYLADYNGHNAAAKVLHITQMGVLDENQKQQQASQRRAFLRELEAMIRLRSLNTVNVFGAVTSLPDRMVLVMELLSGGDLLTLLRKSEKALPEEQSRRIILDICTGMAFLHSKNTVHGDLKSANVLLDGDGRAKIADFGTSRWTQTVTSTGLATYTTKSSQTGQMSIAWSAPEVLESGGSSHESDVYSFGIVVWEVLSRDIPWAKKTRPRDILTAVLRGLRPSFHVDAPADMVDIAKACWGGEPEERPTFRAVLEGMYATDWGGDDE
ncbi:unnamed protein product [Pylaiella littoralis]